MTDIEKMLREGISEEDIISKIKETKTKIAEEEKQKKKQELEEKAKTAKIKKARTDMINSTILYLSSLGIELSKEDTEDHFNELEKWCKTFEQKMKNIKSLSFSYSSPFSFLLDLF